MAASSRSTWPRGCCAVSRRRAPAGGGAGSARRSIFAFAPSGTSAIGTNATGSMYSGNTARNWRRMASASIAAALTTQAIKRSSR
jgi:hypothetical protein